MSFFPSFEREDKARARELRKNPPEVQRILLVEPQSPKE
jgi:hypothetical protein